MSFDRKPPLPSDDHPDLTTKLPDYRSLGEDEHDELPPPVAKNVIVSALVFWAVLIGAIAAASYFGYQAVAK